MTAECFALLDDASPLLDGATVANADSPAALIHVIMQGARTPSTDKGPSILVMPGFGKRLDDKEVAALASFVRQGWSNIGAPVTEREVAKVRTKVRAKATQE